MQIELVPTKIHSTVGGYMTVNAYRFSCEVQNEVFEFSAHYNGSAMAISHVISGRLVLAVEMSEGIFSEQTLDHFRLVLAMFVQRTGEARARSVLASAPALEA